MTLQWSIANRRGILSGSSWLAGHVNDLLELDSESVLAASATGGVWQLTSEIGIPLSMDWDSPNTICLARGPHGPVHIYAGGATSDTRYGVLHQTDVTSAFPLWAPWQSIPLSTDVVGQEVGVIHRIVVDEQKIVLATDTGLWFATIPPGGLRYAVIQSCGRHPDPATCAL